MSEVKAVIRSSFGVTRGEAVPSEGDLPTTLAQHFFPPFPPCPTLSPLMAIHQWQSKGVYMRADGRYGACGRDSHGVCLVPSPQNGLTSSANAEAEWGERNKQKKLRQLQKGKLGVRVLREDCWKIGDENEQWVEPDETSRSNYDPCV